MDAALQAGRGAAEAVALGNIGLSIEDPHASWAWHVQTSKDMLAFSLGLTAARAGWGKAKAVPPELALREEASGKKSTDDGFAGISSELVTPLNPPPGTMMMDATGVIALSRLGGSHGAFAINSHVHVYPRRCQENAILV